MCYCLIVVIEEILVASHFHTILLRHYGPVVTVFAMELVRWNMRTFLLSQSLQRIQNGRSCKWHKLLEELQLIHASIFSFSVVLELVFVTLKNTWGSPYTLCIGTFEENIILCFFGLTTPLTLSIAYNMPSLEIIPFSQTSRYHSPKKLFNIWRSFCFPNPLLQRDISICRLESFCCRKVGT